MTFSIMGMSEAREVGLKLVEFVWRRLEEMTCTAENKRERKDVQEMDYICKDDNQKGRN